MSIDFHLGTELNRMPSQRKVFAYLPILTQIREHLQSFSGRPSVFVSAKYTRDTMPNDAMWVWLENVNSVGFEVCVREFLPFDGLHKDTIVVSKCI